ncbi:MAG: hypothetical protein IJN86_05790, partial [Clostridia bacterium]|nr:hypothetical protein [Clostridia bacterium]
MLVCQVRLLDTTLAYDRAYTYAIPKSLEDKAAVGVIAVVPFGKGNRSQSAFVVSLWQESAGERKP